MMVYFGYITKVEKYRSPAFFLWEKSEVKNETNELIFGIFSCQNSPKQFKEKLQDFGTWFLIGSQNIERYVSLKKLLSYLI
jgi:hypothetical protein